MPDGSPRRVGRQSRHWRFSNAEFDEQEWLLRVDGQRVAVESKPLELLLALLERAGHVVAKQTLLDRIWPNVTVVEASLPTAVRKLRRALGEADGARSVIETVPGIGYRLAVPVTVKRPEPVDAETTSDGKTVQPVRPRTTALATLALATVVAAAAWTSRPSPGLAPNWTREQREQLSALRRLDVPAIERLLNAGWDVNAPYDAEGTNALQYLLNVCEWDPGHDRRKLLLAARTLLDSNTDFFHRNAFGDTAYSIAKAPRYCGPDHPVTVMLRNMCTDSDGGGVERCLATYELARGQRIPG